MISDSDFRAKKNELRRKAEERLSVKPSIDSGSKPAGTHDQLIHDLTVHQIELEMQNEELRKAQQELEQSRDRYLELYHHAPVGYVVTDSAGMILQANQTLAHMLGWDTADLQHTPLVNLLHPDDQKIFLARFRAFYKHPDHKQLDGRMMTRRGNMIHATLRGRRANGSHTPVPDKNLQVPLLISISDVTRQKAAETTILRAKKQWEQTFDCVPDLIAIINDRFEIVRANQALARRLGTSPGDCVGKHCYELFCGNPEAKCLHERCMTGKQTVEAETYNKKLGSHFITTVVPFQSDDSNATWCIHIDHDITDRKRAEKEFMKRHNLESIGTLAGGVAHDFNNILTALIGNIQLGQLKLENHDEAHPYLEEAVNAAFRARDLANRLLTFSKGGDPMIRPVRIETILKEALQLVLSGGNVTYDLHLPDLLEPIIADEVQIQSALQNIITNAKEAMPWGGVLNVDVKPVTVNAGPPDLMTPGRYVKIDIGDAGGGICTAHRDKIFDPYFTTKQMGPQKGMGLGLSISHSIIRKHKGHIGVQSTQGQGTTVTVHLPLVPQPSATAKDNMRQRDVGAGSRRRLLVMDDEKSILEVVRPILQGTHCEVDFAPDGEQALEMYSQQWEQGTPYNALLLDLTIRGGMGAKEVVHRILALDPRAKVAVFSGYSNDPVFSDYRRFGFVGAIKKPFQVDAFKAFIENLLDAHQPEEELDV